MNRTTKLAAVLAMLALAACDERLVAPEEKPAPAPDTVRTPVALPLTGTGEVIDRYTAEVAVRGDWAYTSSWGFRSASGNAIKIWNVAGAITLVDSLIIAPGSTLGDVQISPDGRLLMVAVEHSPNGAIELFDRTNPAKPVPLARFASANTRAGVHTAKFGEVNGRLYAFLSIDPVGSPARLTIVDVSNPAQPVEVFSQQMGRPYVHDVFVRDGLLFTALWDDGLSIWDIGGGGRGGSPAAPVLISNVIPSSGDIHNIWWYQDAKTGSKRYVFLGEEGPGSVGASTATGDIHVIDISTITAPREVALYNVPMAGTHNFWADETNGYLYAAYYNGGVRALDVRGDLGTCPAAQKTALGLCDLRLMGREAGIGLPAGHFVWGVTKQGTAVYASDMKVGLLRLDAAALQR